MTPGVCGCFRCTRPVYGWDSHGRFIQNNLHAHLVPCPDCGRPRSEYRDHGTWGEYACWWCIERTTDPLDATDNGQPLQL